MRLIQSIHNQGGYNVTTDNFFTRVYLATLLLKKKILMVGMVKSNSKGLTKFMTKNDNELHKSSFFFNDDKEILFVKYQCKKKNFNLISTMHNAPSIDQSKKKKTLRYSFLPQEQGRRRRCRPNVAAIFHSHG